MRALRSADILRPNAGWRRTSIAVIATTATTASMINNVFIALRILSLNQVFEFDVGMAVLTFLACLLAVRANGLLWAYMHASEADGT